MADPSTPDPGTANGCVVPCDPDCDAGCHEAHAVAWKRSFGAPALDEVREDAALAYHVALMALPRGASGDAPEDRLKIADAVIKVVADRVVAPLAADRDAALATITRIRAKAEQWAALAPDDDWGDSMDATITADMGRAVLAILDDPAGGGDTDA